MTLDPVSGPATEPPSVRLRPISVDAATDLCSGRRRRAWHPDYPSAESLDAAGMFLQTAAVVDPGPWGIFWVVADGQVVGDIGFHGPPGGGVVTVEIGYSVVAAVRGRGLATAACRLLLARAWRQGAEVVLAETAADNPASQHVLRRVGFGSTGSTATGALTYALSRPTAAPRPRRGADGRVPPAEAA